MTLENKLTHELDLKHYHLEEYFHRINKQQQEKQDMTSWTQDDEPLTTIYFSIRSPAVDHYPANDNSVSLSWQGGATWHQVLWEVMKTVEAHYGYGLKDKVFFKVHELVLQAEEEWGETDLSKQMFTKDLS